MYSLGEILVGVALAVLFCALLVTVKGGAFGGIAKQLIESWDHRYLGVQVTIRSIRLHPFMGKVIITGLKMANPPGYSSEYMLQAGKLVLDIDMCRFLCSRGKQIPVQVLTIVDVEVVAEVSGTSANLRDVIDHLHRVKLINEEDEEQEEVSTYKVDLHRILVQNVGVKVVTSWLGGTDMKLFAPDISYSDFAEDYGRRLSVNDIVAIILLIVLRKAIGNVVGQDLATKLLGAGRAGDRRCLRACEF
mmetsp:Transcript_46815/g.100108  ORF Transcript_46815/g.100108 Transcript_46815/m.100108 type:complete len:247 (+) Transcript_46815:108-848(+)